MNKKRGEDRNVFLSLRNFRSQQDRLDFGDFAILKVQQGPDAAAWRKKLASKHVPSWILEKKFLDYVIKDGDISGSDLIHKHLSEILLLFRLYKPGDLIFSDFVITSDRDSDGSINAYSLDAPSEIKYIFEAESVEHFNRFRSEMRSKPGFKSELLQFSLQRFSSGVNSGFFYQGPIHDKLVDYVIALESLFLIDNPMYFLRGTIAERISRFLDDPDAATIVKKMYDERSDIVHGSNIGSTEQSRNTRIQRLREIVPPFELLIRKVFVAIFEQSFSNKGELVSFMQSLYNPPDEALNIMNKAKNQADQIVHKAKSSGT